MKIAPGVYRMEHPQFGNPPAPYSPAVPLLPASSNMPFIMP
jgi:hypothetical protein